MSSDVFAGSVSDDDYDPQRVWFATRNSKPPYEHSTLRMYYPQWFIHKVTKYLYDDGGRAFSSVQQILHNAEYHGFHHMEQQSFAVSDLVKYSRLINETNQLSAQLATEEELVEAVGNAYNKVTTGPGRDRVRKWAGEVVSQVNENPELVEKLRRYLT